MKASLLKIYLHTHVLKNQTDCIGLYHTIWRKCKSRSLYKCPGLHVYKSKVFLSFSSCWIHSRIAFLYACGSDVNPGLYMIHVLERHVNFTRSVYIYDRYTYMYMCSRRTEYDTCISKFKLHISLLED